MRIRALIYPCIDYKALDFGHTMMHNEHLNYAEACNHHACRISFAQFFE